MSKEIPIWKLYGFATEKAFRKKYPEAYLRSKKKPVSARDSRVMTKNDHRRVAEVQHITSGVKS